MHKFVRNLITEWRRLKLPMTDATAIIAVSGGADSVALLLAIADLRKRKKLGLRFVVAHFDHGLRGDESEADKAFVAALASDLGLEFNTKKGKLPASGNLEQNARKARYEFLLRTAAKHNAFAVLTAHTTNDQAETFLMNLLRGSGIDGLSAMPPVRTFDGADVKLVRPLLRWATRDDTEGFCRASGVQYRSDAMNDDLLFTRVRIRKELIPILRTYNPQIVASLAGTAELISSTDQVPMVPEDLESPLELKILRSLPPADLNRVLREWIKINRGNLRGLNLKHIRAVERLVHSPKSGKTVELPGWALVVRSGGLLRFTNIKVEN